jgi:type I restriction enzyme S subunit
MVATEKLVREHYPPLPDDWRATKLKFVAIAKTSNVDKVVSDDETPVSLCNYTDVYYNDVIRSDLEFMKGSATDAEIERFKLCRGQVILTKDSESWDDIAIPAYVPQDMPNVVCGYHLAVLTPDDELLSGRYLSWLCRSESLNGQFKVSANGVTRYGLGLYAIKNAIVAVPPIREQGRIADFLDERTKRIDALIVRKERLLELLAEKRQALITHAVTKGLNPSVPIKPSGIDWLGDIPEHWKLERLDRLVDPRRPIRYGIVLPGPDFDGGVPIIKGGDVRPDRLDPGSLSRTDPEIEAIHRRSRLAIGDIVYSIRGSYGDVELVPDELAGANLTQDTARIAPIDNVERGWLVLYLKSPPMRQQMAAGAIGATIKGVNIRDLRRAIVAMPPASEQAQIAQVIGEKVRELEAVETKVRGSIHRLHEYRDAVITAAVTGQIAELQ